MATMTDGREFFREHFLSSESPFGRPYLDDLVQRARGYLAPRTEELSRSAETLLDWLLDEAVDPTTQESFLGSDQRERMLKEFTQARKIQVLRADTDLSGIKFIPGLSWRELLGVFAQDCLFQIYTSERIGTFSEYGSEDDPTMRAYFDEAILIREATEAVMFGELEEQVAVRAKALLTEKLARAGTESHKITKPLRALVIARYTEKYTTSSYRSAARKIFESLIEEKIIEWHERYKLYFLEYSNVEAVLRNEEPWDTFERWIGAHAKAGKALKQ